MEKSKLATGNSSKQVAVTLGAIFGFFACTGLGYYLGWSNTWSEFRRRPQIGADKLSPQLVVVVKDISADGEITFDNVEERRLELNSVASDCLGFAADCMGRKLKWGLKKGSYVSLHDLKPATVSVSVNDQESSK